VTGEAALAAKDLGPRQGRVSSGSRATGIRRRSRRGSGLARVALASGEESALAELEAIEKGRPSRRDDVDTVIFARITRAAALGKQGAAKNGLEMLVPLVDTPAMVKSQWHGANVERDRGARGGSCGARMTGAAKPHARVAATH